MRLTDHPRQDVSPALSPDGTQIAFMSDRDTAETNGAFDIYVMRVDGSGVRRLTTNAALD